MSNAPVYVGWEPFHVAERAMFRRGKTHARSVVLDGMTVVVDVGGHTTSFPFSSFPKGMRPSYQNPPTHARLDGLRVTAWEWR